MAHIEKRTVKVMKEVDEERFMLELTLEELELLNQTFSTEVEFDWWQKNLKPIHNAITEALVKRKI